jgi:hypothetical protein
MTVSTIALCLAFRVDNTPERYRKSCMPRSPPVGCWDFGHFPLTAVTGSFTRPK